MKSSVSPQTPNTTHPCGPTTAWDNTQSVQSSKLVTELKGVISVLKPAVFQHFPNYFTKSSTLWGFKVAVIPQPQESEKKNLIAVIKNVMENAKLKKAQIWLKGFDAIFYATFAVKVLRLVSKNAPCWRRYLLSVLSDGTQFSSPCWAVHSPC